jgi:uncharacterized protein (TIGR01244 family)
MSQNAAFYAQITPEHVAQIKEAGFKTIINNRPDGEEPNQPLNDDIEQAAKEAGLAYHYDPVVASQINAKACEEFAEIFNAAEKPVFMFCRTGNRCNILYHSAVQLGLIEE